MEINKIKRSLLVLFFSFLAIGAQAQLEQAVKKIFAGDTITNGHVPLKRDSDSIHLADMRKSLEEARLNEANMRMEMEQMKLQMATADSVKYVQQRQRIDSLRQFTKGIPVVADGDTLFYLFTKRGGYTPQQRAQMTGAAIEEIGRRFNLQPDSVAIDHSDIVSDLMYGSKVLLSLTDQDALWEGVSRDSLAKERQQNVVAKLHEMKAEHGLWRMAKRVLYFVLVIVGQYFLFRTKDIHSKGLVGNFNFPDAESFDIDVSVILVRSHSKKVLADIHTEGYIRFVDQAAAFDYIEYGSYDTYELSFRILRFPISTSTYECIVTNLPRDEFPVERIKTLYNAR